MATQFSSNFYNSLPCLRNASHQLISRGLEDLISTEIRDVFLKHGVHQQVGLALLHRHFDISTNEILVNIGNVARPWDTTLARPEVLNCVEPSQWGFSRETKGPVPCEYTYEEATGGYPDILDEDGFFAELEECLENHQIASVFGVELLPAYHSQGVDGRPASGVELTSGRSNITLPFKIEKTPKVDEVLWQFSPDPNALSFCTGYRYCYAPVTSGDGNQTGHFSSEYDDASEG